MDPRVHLLETLPRLRELVSLNGRTVGVVRVGDGVFVAVRPGNLAEPDDLKGREFYYGEARYEILAVEPIWDESLLAREAALKAEPDLRKRQAQRLALDAEKAVGPTFLRLRAKYTGAGPQ